MEITYSFIRDSRICELSISHLCTNQFLLKLFIRDPAKELCGISMLRIILSTDPSLRRAKWKNLTDLYAIPQKGSAEFRICV